MCHIAFYTKKHQKYCIQSCKVESIRLIIVLLCTYKGMNLWKQCNEWHGLILLSRILYTSHCYRKVQELVFHGSPEQSGELNEKLCYNKFSVDLCKVQMLFSSSCASTFLRDIMGLCWLIKWTLPFRHFFHVQHILYDIGHNMQSKSQISWSSNVLFFVIFLIVTFPLHLLLIFFSCLPLIILH